MEIITFNSPFTFEDFKLSTYLSINNSTLFKILPVHCLPDPHPSCGSESKSPNQFVDPDLFTTISAFANAVYKMDV